MNKAHLYFVLRCRLALLLFLSIGSSNVLLAADLVPLFLEPTAQAKPLESVPTSAAIIHRGTPVLEETLRNDGWYWNYRAGTYIGFIKTDRISGKELIVASGTPVYLNQDSSSPLLATIEDPAVDAVELHHQLGDWTEIQFTKSVPVYFQKPQANRAAPLSSDQTNLPSYSPKEPLKIAPMGAAGNALHKSTQNMPLASTAHSVKAEIPRYFSGTLKKRTDLLSIGAEHKLHLVNDAGQRIALIDASEISKTTFLPPYFNHTVIIEGIPTTQHGTSPLVIQAKTLHFTP